MQYEADMRGIQLKNQKRILMDDVDINWEITERETQAFRTM